MVKYKKSIMAKEMFKMYLKSGYEKEKFFYMG